MWSAFLNCSLFYILMQGLLLIWLDLLDSGHRNLPVSTHLVQRLQMGNSLSSVYVNQNTSPHVWEVSTSPTELSPHTAPILFRDTETGAMSCHAMQPKRNLNPMC